jgi:hypothetical protein
MVQNGQEIYKQKFTNKSKPLTTIDNDNMFKQRGSKNVNQRGPNTDQDQSGSSRSPESLEEAQAEVVQAAPGEGATDTDGAGSGGI